MTLCGFVLYDGFHRQYEKYDYNSLALEQVPAYRGTMMLLSQLSQIVGGALGTGIGGVILQMFDYGTMGLLGVSVIIAFRLFHVFTIAPTQYEKNAEKTS